MYDDPEHLDPTWAHKIIVYGVTLAVVILLFGVVRCSHAHDHSRPDLTPWFESLHSGKGPCCDGSDALAIDDPDWDSANGHYRVKLEGEWVDVPDDAVITEPNRDGRALVWPYRKDGKLNQVRCFMPGAGT